MTSCIVEAMYCRSNLGVDKRRARRVVCARELGGERFQAERFGPQWSQAVLLVAAHGVFLGVPTGIAVAAVLQVAARLRRT